MNSRVQVGKQSFATSVANSTKGSWVILICLQGHSWKLVLNQDVSALLWPVLWVSQNIMDVSQLAMEIRVLPLLKLLTRHFSLQLMWGKSKRLFLPHCTQSHSITEFKEGPWCCFLGQEITFALAQSYNLETGLILMEQKILFFSSYKSLNDQWLRKAPEQQQDVIPEMCCQGNPWHAVPEVLRWHCSEHSPQNSVFALPGLGMQILCSHSGRFLGQSKTNGMLKEEMQPETVLKHCLTPLTLLGLFPVKLG